MPINHDGLNEEISYVSNESEIQHIKGLFDNSDPKMHEIAHKLIIGDQHSVDELTKKALDDGFTANDIEDQGFTVSHTFTEPGTYIVRLTVGDESEEDTVDVQILVEDTRFLGLNVGFGEGGTTTVVILILTLFVF